MVPMTKLGFNPVNALIRESEGFAPIQDRLQRISRLQHSFVDALPVGLVESCRVATVEGSTLVIAAANGASAAKLKQMLPRLLESFRENKKQEQEVTVIQVIVQPDYFRLEPVATPGPARFPMPTDKLADLAASLDESPLKDTIERIRKKRERVLTSRGRKS